ncbi:MAG: hypothetical protein Q9208_005469 [Pyrenodesmia sp. 3 TL-2023]
MKFSVAITAIVALLPIALAAPAPAALDGDVLDGGVLSGDVLDDTVFDDVAFNETTTQDNELERRMTRESQLSIQVYKNKGCKGPLFENKNIKYNDKMQQPFEYKSYKLLKPLLWGETLRLMSGQFGGDKCARVTSHTSKPLKKGCYELGGDTGKIGNSQCFQLIRSQGGFYPGMGNMKRPE